MNVQKVRPELAAALAVLLVGIWLGYFLANRAIRTNAIQQECAHYDSKSGEFTWGVVQ
jgi:hypothetical protein